MIFIDKKRGKYRDNCWFSLIKSLLLITNILLRVCYPISGNHRKQIDWPLEMICKNSLDLTFFLWKGAFPQGKHYKEILSAFRTFSLQSFSQQNLSGQTQISVLQSPPCGLGHCFSQLLVHYFDAIVYASKWKDGKKSSCWVVLPGKEGLSSPELMALSLPPTGSGCFLVLCSLTPSPDQAAESSWT